MIRIVATILVAVQALLPPGMCLCQFVPSAPVARQAHETASLPQPSVADEETCCSCPACRVAVPAAPTHDRAPTDREAPQKHHPVPTPSAPCSGCPVVSAGPVGRVAILTITEQVSLDLAIQFVVSTVEVAVRHADRPNPSPSPTTQPLFVRHCALLI